MQTWDQLWLKSRQVLNIHNHSHNVVTVMHSQVKRYLWLSCVTAAVRPSVLRSFVTRCVWVLQHSVSQRCTECFSLLGVHSCTFVRGFPFGKCASSLTRYRMGLALQRPVKVWGGAQSTGQGDPLTGKKTFPSSLSISRSRTPFSFFLCDLLVFPWLWFCLRLVRTLSVSLHYKTVCVTNVVENFQSLYNWRWY